jgi:nucleoside-diphosphate-sugar epimerase
MSVLIAGGTGFIGRELTLIALARGWDVHLITRDPDKRGARFLADQGAHLIQGDLTDVQGLRTIFSQVRPRRYFHNAGWYELGIPASKRDRMWAVNVQGLANALEAAEQHNVQKIVLTTSTTALGDTGGDVVDESFERRSEPKSWYERSMDAAHQVALEGIEAGLPIVMGSPAQVIGPDDHAVFGIMLRLFLRNLLPPTLWGPEGTFSFVHVDDVALGLVRIMEDGRLGENYFLAGSLMSNREMVAFWKAQTGRSLPIIWLPRGIAMAIGYVSAPLLRIIGQPAFISPEVVRSSYVSFKYSAEKIRDELGVVLRSAHEAWAHTIAVEST